MIKRRIWACFGVVCLACCSAGCSEIRWRPDLGGAMRLAAERGQVVVVQVWSPFNADCERMEKEVFNRKEVKETMLSVIPVRLNAAFNRQFQEQYGLYAVPSFAVFGPNGALLRSTNGFMDEGRLRAFIEVAKLSL
jgi:thioredoxin-related protein